MYAVMKTGGKQYRVAVGDKLKVEQLKAEIGDSVNFDQVLMVADGDKIEVGTPTLGIAVQGTVISIGRGDKLRILKFRRRQNSRTRGGHRQHYTEVEITGIGGKAPVKKKVTTKAVTKKKSTTKTEAPKKTVERKKKVTAKKTMTKKPATKEAVTTSTSKKKSKIDDLTKISGIGPVIVAKLAALGVTTFEEVAAWNKADIEKFDAELNFKGRIERDDWIKQAKKLAKG